MGSLWGGLAFCRSFFLALFFFEANETEFHWKIEIEGTPDTSGLAGLIRTNGRIDTDKVLFTCHLVVA